MKVPKVSVVGNSLQIENIEKGRISVELEWPIAQVLPLKTAFLVRTEPEPGSCANRNVCAIGHDGKLVWEVSRRNHIYDDSPYTNIEFREGNLLLNNWDGLTVLVDPVDFLEKAQFYGK